MAKENIKISEQEQIVKKEIYSEILNKYYWFFHSLHRRFLMEKAKVPKKFFIDTIKGWLAIEDVEFDVKRFTIIFGNQDRDGWTYCYDWNTGRTYTRISTLLDDEEMAEKRAKQQEENEKKIAKKLKEFGLDAKYIGTVFQNKELDDLKIRWDGIALDRRKYPIKFYDFRDKREKCMVVDYFKSHYYYKVKEKENA